MTLKILITGGNGNIAKIITHNLLPKYNISAPSKLELNILNYNELKDYLKSHNFDILIHTAITGGRRTKIDTSDVVYSNLLMMENILLFADRFKMIINLDSAAIYDRSTDISNRKENDLFTIPMDYYGFSKYMIFMRTLQYENIYHLRIFNLFHDNEEPNRFIKTCRLAKAENSVVTILEDKYFDFFSAEDFIKVLEYYLTHLTSIKEKVINLCYEEKYKLSDIAKMIQPDTNLIKVIEVSQRNYTGDGTLLKQLGLDFSNLIHCCLYKET